MEDYAVIVSGGKQYLVKPGDVIEVEKIEGEPNKNISFDRVLLTSIKGKLAVGKPYIKNSKISAKVIAQKKGTKIRVAKFRAKSRYRRVKGHRQLLTQVTILPFKTN